jgi:aspartate racemase
MKMGFIQSYLKENFNLETIIPEKKYIENCNHLISNELTKGIFNSNTKTFFNDQIDKLMDSGAEGIILGCTELPILINQSDTNVPLIDTTLSHAELACDFILQ